MLLRFLVSLIFTLLIFPQLVQATEPAPQGTRPCMTKHMQDAIRLNKERKPLYERLTAGKSNRVTEHLIGMERRLLLGSPILDFWARPYQGSGIDIICEDVVDMALTPPFRSRHPDGTVPKESYRRVQVGLVKTQLEERLRANDFSGLAWLSDQYVQQLGVQPRFNCLVRHMLESIRRTAMLAPKHEKKALAKGMRSPRFLAKVILKSHLDLLYESAQLDILAAPMQAEGIMIICQDIPPISKPF